MCGSPPAADRLRRLALVHKQLLSIARPRIVLRSVSGCPQNLFRLVVFVLQPVSRASHNADSVSEGSSRLISRYCSMARFHRFRLAVARADIPQAPQIDPTQKTPAIARIRVAFQDPLARLPHRESRWASNTSRRRSPMTAILGIERIRFLVRLDRLGGVLRAAGRFVLRS